MLFKCVMSMTSQYVVNSVLNLPNLILELSGASGDCVLNLDKRNMFHSSY